MSHYEDAEAAIPDIVPGQHTSEGSKAQIHAALALADAINNLAQAIYRTAPPR